MKIVDTRGEKCPKPIIETKKALREVNVGETFCVITDNKASFTNLSRFLADHKVKFTATEKGGTWEFIITKVSAEAISTPADDYCDLDTTSSRKGDYSVAISSELMGDGDEVLGKRLMHSFFLALSVTDELPFLIAFYNSGAKLAANDSGVFNFLVELEKKGVEIVVCGTCVDHYGLAGRIDSSKIVDMYYILQKLASSDKVIRP